MLGIATAEQEAYRLLLRRAPVKVSEAPEVLRRPPAEVARLLASLAATGLVAVRDGTIVALPTEETLGRLVAEEKRRLADAQEQLEALRRLIPVLSAEQTSFREPHDRLVTFRTIPSSQALEVLRGLTAEFGGDLRWLRADQWRLPQARAADRWVAGLLRDGRRSRVIYPARALEEAPDAVRRRADLGEQVRVLPELPGRLAVIGDSAAVLPHRFDRPDDLVLVLEQPALVSSLTMLFDSLWARALVVPGIGGELDKVQASARRLLLDQLARGAKDEQIARTLGLSLRTVRRRVADLMAQLDAASRFQAGVEAIRRGWL
ncbi:helix-turn-helix domain-containing protein [soil metagenome]